MRKGTIIATTLALTVAAALLLIMKPRGPMPLSAAMTSEFQEATSRAVRELQQDGRSRSTTVEAALAFSMAVEKLGYDTDLTLLTWLSPQYVQELRQGPASNVVNNIRLHERLVAVALGDQGNEQDFKRIIGTFGEELQQAALTRR